MKNFSSKSGWQLSRLMIAVLVFLLGAAVPGLEATQLQTLGDVGADDGGVRSQLLAMSGHDAEDGDSLIYRLVKYAGKFHVLVIHFPIAFLLGACICQWWFVKSGHGSQVAVVMLWFGALGAAAAAMLGWSYAYDSTYFGDSKDLLFYHRWLGTATAAVALLVLLLKGKFGKIGLAIMLTVAAILVGLAGHFGGSLVYGADYFTKF